MAVHEQLAALAELLRDPAPVPVDTVALAAALLQDGGGPLYGGGARSHSPDGPLLRRLAAFTGGQPARFHRPPAF
jgi:hypothetical protein